MRVGIPTEIKNNENRVAITPAGCLLYTSGAADEVEPV
jgi:alanine dehydrogenase